jgi:hypothetical protein
MEEIQVKSQSQKNPSSSLFRKDLHVSESKSYVMLLI